MRRELITLLNLKFMSQIEYVGVDTILFKLHKSIKNEDVSELDVIDWTDDALGFLASPESLEESVTLTEVINYETNLPKGFKKAIMLARHNNWKKEDKCGLTKDIIEEAPAPKSECESLCDPEMYRPHIDLKWQYIDWAQKPFYVENFTPIRPTKNVFFNSLACKTNLDLYENCQDEYTIVGIEDRKLRFSFKEGYIAMAYYKTPEDENGFPLIPNTSSHISAIIAFIKWKLAERYSWEGREGFARLAQDNERQWLKYVKQANNRLKMESSEGRVFNNR